MRLLPPSFLLDLESVGQALGQENGHKAGSATYKGKLKPISDSLCPAVLCVLVQDSEELQEETWWELEELRAPEQVSQQIRDNKGTIPQDMVSHTNL